MNNHYGDIRKASIFDLFSANDFRLVRAEDSNQSCGISEIYVKIYIKKPFAKNLSFSTQWDGELHGFVKCKYNLYEKTGFDNTVKITFSDWDNMFAVIFEDKEGNERPVYSVSHKDIEKLLEECIKPEKLD